MIIITRAEWGARPPKRTVHMTTWSQRTGFVTHYSAANKFQTVRQIQNFHMDTNDWADIGYNFLVDYKGNIYEGRQGTWMAIGAHVQNHNTANIGVCFIGTNNDITDEGKRSIRWLYDEANRRAGKTLTKRYHSLLYPTSCPGDNLRNWVIGGMASPAVTPVPQEDDMGFLHGQVPTGQEAIIVCTPWNQSAISFGADLGSGQARLRVAEHAHGEAPSWTVHDIIVRAGDAERVDLPARPGVDRRSIMRLPIDENDDMTTPVGYIAWWV